jgi:2,3-bisphosphoglycerate-independent phosphoglycerate mutase
MDPDRSGGMDAALVILDGWGLSDPDQEGRDAVKAADTSTFDGYWDRSAATATLRTYGGDVGLPTDQMGNSEVGHLTIGAGRIVEQAYTRIENAIASGELDAVAAIDEAFSRAAESGGRVHLLGLISDGGVHADQEHVHALIRAAADRGVEAVTHAFTDGRDTPPKSGTEYLGALEAVVDEAGTGDVATVSGRYYAMDRDQNWGRTHRAYEAIVERAAEHAAPSAVDAVAASYERGDTDEFVEPTLIEGGEAMAAGDAAVFCNFRADRARQLVRMLADIEPEWGFETDPPAIEVTTMTQYDKTFDLPVAFPPNQPADTLGEVIADAGGTQLRIAESEKYPHVTYFLNGGREVEFPGEHREIVPSPDVPTYDLQPEMSAPAVTDTAIEIIEFEDPDLLVLNYANPDMVGHTGDFDAAVAAVEAVDEQLGPLVETCLDAEAAVFVTADHGNADDMGTEDAPHTAHTFNPVPFLALGEGVESRTTRDDGALKDVAPTLLSAMGLAAPDAMTGRPLLE